MYATVARGQRVEVIGTPERYDREGREVESRQRLGHVVTSVDSERVVVSFDDGGLAVVEVRLCEPV